MGNSNSNYKLCNFPITNEVIFYTLACNLAQFPLNPLLYNKNGFLFTQKRKKINEIL